MKSLSLKAKLLGIVVIINVIAQVLFGIMSNNQFKSLRNEQEGFAKSFATNYIDKIDRNLFERYGDVQAFAFSESARSGNPKRIMDFMSDMMTTYAPIYDVMIVTNASGRVIAVNQVDKNGKPLDTSSILNKDYSNEEWFKAAIGGKIEPGTALYQELRLDPDVAKVVGNNGAVMNFTAPIRDKQTGEILGVWSNRMSWSDVIGQITNEELKGARSTRNKNDIYISLMDDQGNYIVHPQTEDFVLKRQQDHFEKWRDLQKDKLGADMYNVSEKYFTGEVVAGFSRSKGYSLYPGKGWIAKVEVSTADPIIQWTWMMVGTIFFVLLVGLVVGWKLVNSVSNSLAGLMKRLTAEASEVKKASQNITQGSQNLAQASTEQASALQETAASVEETNAMVKKSAENAQNSRDVSRSSQEAAERGKKTVGDMITAIEEINISNSQIMHQVENGNQQIAEIVKVITEIGNKTKVINDIVFQTKLLSFNASVEAARAGEHGKGFAVVAEEVGNLAQMSGNAAKEIGDMLGDSIKKVESIVSETQSKVSRLIEDGKRKVESGTLVAKQCSEILEEVVQNVSTVNGMVGEISVAAQEQSSGINEITKAMNQLDQVTHENASTSQQTAHAAHQLTNQAEMLLEVVNGLEEIVYGGQMNASSSSHFGVADRIKSAAHSAPVQSAPSNTEISPFGKAASRSDKKTYHSDPVPGRALTKVVGGNDVPDENDPRFRDL